MQVVQFKKITHRYGAAMSVVQRYISSSFWSDDWVDSLSRDGKLLYMYLLTNECTNIAGVYKITLKRMKDDTGIPRDDIKELLISFEESGKAFYVDEYMILPKWPKHQRIGERSTLLVGMYAVLRGLPNEIKAFLCADQRHYYYDLSKVFNNFKQLGGKIDDSKKPIDDTEKPAFPGQSPEKSDRLSHDLDLDLDSDLNLDSDFKENNGGSNLKVPENKTTTTLSFSKLQEEIKNSTGYLVDDKIVTGIFNLHLPEEWLSGPLCFFSFTKEVVAQKYPGKSSTDQRTLFISAVTTWENLREEYPSWLQARKKKAETKKTESAREQIPKICDCGGVIQTITGKLVCSQCSGIWEFRASESRYVKIEYVPEVHFNLSSIRSKSAQNSHENTEIEQDEVVAYPDVF